MICTHTYLIFFVNPCRNKVPLSTITSNSPSYIYPNFNGIPLNKSQKKYYRAYSSYFKIKNFNNWTLKNILLIASKKKIEFTMELLRIIYNGWLNQLLQKEIINSNIYQEKLSEAEVKCKFSK
jgi:hypothetical protein